MIFKKLANKYYNYLYSLF